MPLIRLCLLMLTLSSDCLAQEAVPVEARSKLAEESSQLNTNKAEERYSYNEIHDPNGIGKFYMGREIARVMGHQGISWLERPERDEEEGLRMLMECLDLKPGMVVADIGAGSGVISLMLAKHVGETGEVLAVDIQPEMLAAISAKCKELGVTNIENVLGTVKSPRLEHNTVDLIVMVDVYHEFNYPYEMLSDMSKALKPGGRIAFVEYRKEDPEIPIKLIHKMSEVQVKTEALLAEHNLKYNETINKLPRQHVVMFEKKTPASVSTDQ